MGMWGCFCLMASTRIVAARGFSSPAISWQEGKIYTDGSVADPDPGLGVFVTPGSGMGESQHPDPGTGMNNPDHIF
jgi:hypothetical protein